MRQRSNSSFETEHALLASLGKTFGVFVAGDHELAVIERYGVYAGVRGPGRFRTNWFTERVRGYFDITPLHTSEPVPNIHTQDALLVAISVSLQHRLDPRIVPNEQAKLLVSWNEETHRLNVRDLAQRVLQDIVGRYPAKAIAGAGALTQIEREFQPVLQDALAAIGIVLMRCQIREMNVPDLLRARYETIAQRDATIDDMRMRDPAELAKALETEIIEALPKMSARTVNIDPKSLTRPAEGDAPAQAPTVSSPQKQQLPAPKPPDDVIDGEVSGDEPISRL